MRKIIPLVLLLIILASQAKVLALSKTRLTSLMPIRKIRFNFHKDDPELKETENKQEAKKEIKKVEKKINLEEKIVKEKPKLKKIKISESLSHENVLVKKMTKRERAEYITRGKGIWVNIWNYPSNTKAFMKKLNKYDIDTIYLQINRSTTAIFKHPKKLDQILEDAHENNIKVIGWSYCYLKNDLVTDAKKFVIPARYVSPKGHKLDGMAADIEENVSVDAVKRYTRLIKRNLPKNYPLLAIVFSPRIKQNYPWKYIGSNWDVLMPMTYWHGLKNRNHRVVHDFVEDTILDLKRLTGRKNLNIHLITDGERTTSEEVKISLDVARKHNIKAGVSLYPEHLASHSMLQTLKNFQE